MGLSGIDVVSLAEAREKALEARKLVKAGIDPIEDRNAQRARLAVDTASSRTFQDCAEKFIASHEKGWRNPKHRAQWRNTLATYAFPVFGDVPVDAVDTAMVTEVIEPIWATKTETATRLHGRIEAILDWAKARGYRTSENPARWRGHVENLLPKASKVRKGAAPRRLALRGHCLLHESPARARRRLSPWIGVPNSHRRASRRGHQRSVGRG